MSIFEYNEEEEMRKLREGEREIWERRGKAESIEDFQEKTGLKEPRQLHIWLYSGETPQFIEEKYLSDHYLTSFPQAEAASMENLLAYCSILRSQTEMLHFPGSSDRKHFKEKYLTPLFETGKLKMSIADKTGSPKQKYMKA